MQTMNKDDVLRKWRERGFTGYLWVDTPGQVWQDYVHEADELFMLLEGDIELEIAGKRLRPKPGEEILIPAHNVHTVRNIGQSASHWLYAYKGGD